MMKARKGIWGGILFKSWFLDIPQFFVMMAQKVKYPLIQFTSFVPRFTILSNIAYL